MRHSAGTWSGKTSEVPYDPEFGSKTGYAFPVASLVETAFRNELWNGTRFPIGASNGNRVPESSLRVGRIFR